MGAPPVDPLGALAGIARELGDEGAATDAVALRQRVNEGRFFVACVGQFKRGKSTVINALVGDEVLPVGVIPVTAVVTVVRYGDVRRVRVKTRQAGWRDVAPSDLSAYVAEEHNPDNVKEVLGVEAFVPSPLLACGMCLVDTPGLGSVHASNTAATREFLPHIDAALVVLGADPPISGDELALVQEVAREVAHLVFVINKADRLADTDVAQARVFTSKVVAGRLQRAAPEIFIVSAKERTRDGPTRDWATLERSLATLAQEGGGELVQAARRRGLARVTARLEHDIAVHRTALERPLEESELRLAAMTHAVEDAQRALRQLEYLFRAEEDAIRRLLEEQRNVFLRESVPVAAADLLGRLNAGDPGTAPRTAAFAMAQAIAHERLEKWSLSIQPEAEDCYRRATSAFVTLGNDFLRRLVATGDDAFAGLPREIEPEAGFRTASHFYFTEILTVAEPPSMTGVLDALRNREQAGRAAHGRALPYLERLLDTNSSRMINDLVTRVRESGARLRSELVTTLRAVTTTAVRAIERARASHGAGGAAVQQELWHLDELAAQVRAIRP